MRDIKINNDTYRETKFTNYYITQYGKIAKIKIIDDELQYFFLMKPEILKSGHKRVEINGKHYLIHRLIFEVWSDEKLDNTLVIDHKDANPGNNDINNLRQVTQKENIENSIFHGNFGHNNNTRIEVINTDTNKTKIYNSVKDFLKDIQAPEYMIKHGGLSSIRKKKEYNKYKWRKINEH